MREAIHEITHGRKIIILLGLIILAAILAFLLKDIVQITVIPVLFYIIWLLRIVYESLPQGFWWVALLLVLLVIAVKSLIRKSDASGTLNSKSSLNKSRLELWIKWLEQADQGGYFKWYLAHKLSLLTLTVLSSQERYSNDQLDIIIRQGLSNLPDNLQEYMLIGLDNRMSFNFSAKNPVPFFSQPTVKLTLQPEEIIEFLEDQLEID